MYIINFAENAVAENAVGVCVSDNELAIIIHTLYAQHSI